jgi:hypothetical protein
MKKLSKNSKIWSLVEEIFFIDLIIYYYEFFFIFNI